MAKRTEMRLLERGIREGWDIPADVLKSVPDALLDIIENGTDRDKIAAAKVLVAMRKVDADLARLHLHLHQPAAPSPEPAKPPEEMTMEERRASLVRRLEALKASGAIDDDRIRDMCEELKQRKRERAEMESTMRSDAE